MSTRLLQIKLSEDIIKKIQADIEGTSLKSVENFIETLVRQRFPELEQPVYSAEEEEIIRERLRKLGYID
ncbi:MAG: hypothetical protein NWE88_03920 [Candidatus Bathyarchaeota archaeon]|nr:hypothetical protein [Candidatus Bathyarchaeota archaeon]